ncbi:MAG: hypothetical protein KGI71_04225 [Patescibacteria group bacterium]|nr:hypothetical protein [Patescibacteria group bacterium]
MSEYDNNLRGALFKNEKRPGKNDPDYKGQAEIDRKPYWVSAWINESKKDGSKYMALRFEPKMAREHQGAAKNPPAKKADDFDDDLSGVPF